MANLLQDLRYAARMLAKSPGFTVVAILTLALGIGANTAIFSAVNAILIRPLPYKDSSRLVNVWSTLSYFPDFNVGESPADLTDIQAGNHVFEKLAAYRSDTMNLTGEGEPEEALVASVSAELFATLGVRPPIGRTFTSDDEKPQRGNVVILSEALWRGRFGADPRVVGKNVTINQKPYEVIGVMSAGFRFPGKTDLWVPLALTDKELHDRIMHGTSVVAKLKSGVKLQEAQAEMSAVGARLAAAYPDEDKGLGIKLVSLHEGAVGRVRSALLVLLGAVGFVLLIACANVGNLALARGLQRQKEMGIRVALGASRTRIVRLLMVESLQLAAMGGLIGVLFAWWGIDALRAWAPTNTPRLEELHVQWPILGWSLVISAFAGILFGLFPALQSSRPDLNAALKESGSASRAGSVRSRLRDALVVAEVALALILLAGSALTIQSLARLARVDTGFRTDHLLTMSIHLSQPKYAEEGRQLVFLDQSLERLKSIPGVVDVGASSGGILKGGRMASTITIEGVEKSESSVGENVTLKYVSADFFTTLGMRLLGGRNFNRADVNGTLPVAIINEAAARRYWTNSPIGKRLSVGQDDQGHPIWNEIVGVVNDTRDVRLNVPSKPEVYLSFAQHPLEFIHLFLRTTGAPISVASAAQAQIWSVDRDQPVAEIAAMDVALAENVAEPRFQTFLLVAFGALGLALTLIGIYGVISYSVRQRTHEIGIRMALGAQPRDVLRNVLWDGLKLTITGVSIGLAGALALSRLLASLLFEIRATDPATFASVAFLLATVAMAACFIPARRATRVDPLIALRYE